MSDPPIEIFISYARNKDDTDFVNRLEGDLLLVRGFRPWVDRRKLEGGQHFLDKIQNAIDSCQVLLVVLSDEAIKSDYVKMEYRYAQNEHKLVIPVQHRPISEKIPIDLRGLQYIDFQSSYAQGLKDLFTALGSSVPPPSITTAKVSYFYAHEDERLCREFETHLALLQQYLRQQGINVDWHRDMVTPGMGREQIIDSHLNTADIILPLISPNFMASGFSHSAEMRQALKRHERKDAKVLPIMLRQVFLEATPFNHLKVLPTDGKPVDYPLRYRRDKAFSNVIQGTFDAITDFFVQKYGSKAGTLPPQRKEPAWIHPPLEMRLQGIIQIALIAFIILSTIGGGGLVSFLAIKGSLFMGSPTTTPTAQGTVPLQNTGTPGTAKLKLAWTYTTKGHIEESSPVVANGMVYIGSLDHKLYAIDAKSGAFRWAFATAGPIRSSPAVFDGMVYIGSLDHNLYALNALSGAKQWSFSTGDGIYSSPVVANGILYFGSDDGNLYALDAHSGAKKWFHSTSAQIVSTPAVANGMIYIGSEDDNLYALDAGSGAVKWSKNLGNAITSSPIVSLSDNIVYIISWTGTLSAFDMALGAKVWDNPSGGVGSKPVVANGVLYIGDNVSYILYAIDSTSGTERWHYPQFYSPPANGVTYQLSFPNGGITSSPAVANGVVYIGSADYNLYAIDARSGNELASYATGGSILSSPVVANGMVYVGSSDNKLYAFHLAGT